MEYIKPLKKVVTKARWSISPQTKAVVSYYAMYAGITEDEVVDRILIQLRDDPEFIEWLNKKRRKKRALDQIYGKKDGEQEVG